jgi:hypothetical protein
MSRITKTPTGLKIENISGFKPRILLDNFKWNPKTKTLSIDADVLDDFMTTELHIKSHVTGNLHVYDYVHYDQDKHSWKYLPRISPNPVDLVLVYKVKEIE